MLKPHLKHNGFRLALRRSILQATMPKVYHDPKVFAQFGPKTFTENSGTLI